MNEIVYEPVQSENWPTKEWPSSTPEMQGMDSARLLELVTYYQNKHQEHKEIIIDSITVIRNNHIVADFYFNPLFPKNKKHIINSCTKSITGILMGIAIEKGHIKDVNVPVLDFF